MTLRWIINLWMVGIPWLWLLMILWSWNLYVNIFWNNWWAEGNIFLMLNTLYIAAQSLVTLPLMFEIPFVLRWIKPFRVVSLMSAIIYNILFMGSVVDFFVVTNFEDEDTIEEDGFGDMFMSLIIFYNLVENFPIVIINCGIMIKEAILPFF